MNVPIQKLYRIEKQINGLSVEEKFNIRQTKSVLLLNEFKLWLEQSAKQLLPKSALGTAVRYTLNQWHKLIGYSQSGLTNIDNNRAERAVKPFVIGRNYVHVNISEKMGCLVIPLAALMRVLSCIV